MSDFSQGLERQVQEITYNGDPALHATDIAARIPYFVSMAAVGCYAGASMPENLGAGALYFAAGTMAASYRAYKSEHAIRKEVDATTQTNAALFSTVGHQAELLQVPGTSRVNMIWRGFEPQIDINTVIKPKSIQAVRATESSHPSDDLQRKLESRIDSQESPEIHPMGMVEFALNVQRSGVRRVLVPEDTAKELFSGVPSGTTNLHQYLQQQKGRPSTVKSRTSQEKYASYSAQQFIKAARSLTTNAELVPEAQIESLIGLLRQSHDHPLPRVWDMYFQDRTLRNAHTIRTARDAIERRAGDVHYERNRFGPDSSETGALTRKLALPVTAVLDRPGIVNGRPGTIQYMSNGKHMGNATLEQLSSVTPADLIDRLKSTTTLTTQDVAACEIAVYKALTIDADNSVVSEVNSSALANANSTDAVPSRKNSQSVTERISSSSSGDLYNNEPPIRCVVAAVGLLAVSLVMFSGLAGSAENHFNSREDQIRVELAEASDVPASDIKDKEINRAMSEQGPLFKAMTVQHAINDAITGGLHHIIDPSDAKPPISQKGKDASQNTPLNLALSDRIGDVTGNGNDTNQILYAITAHPGVSTEGYWTQRVANQFGENSGTWSPDIEYLDPTIEELPQRPNSETTNLIEVTSATTFLEGIYDIPVLEGTVPVAAEIDGTQDTLELAQNTNGTYALADPSEHSNSQTGQITYWLESSPTKVRPHANESVAIYDSSAELSSVQHSSAQITKAWQQVTSADTSTGSIAASREQAAAMRSGFTYKLDPFKGLVNAAGTPLNEAAGYIPVLAASMNRKVAICNSAAAALVLANSNLNYATGFLNTDTPNSQNLRFLSSHEAHAYAVTPSGEVIDATPSRKDNTLTKFFSEDKLLRQQGAYPYGGIEKESNDKALNLALLALIGSMTLGTLELGRRAAVEAAPRFYYYRMNQGRLAETKAVIDTALYAKTPVMGDIKTEPNVADKSDSAVAIIERSVGAEAAVRALKKTATSRRERRQAGRAVRNLRKLGRLTDGDIYQIAERSARRQIVEHDLDDETLEVIAN